MSVTVTPAEIHVALIGNPNTGKSTLFNSLAGVRQRVGNYPGVTVEKKTGRMDHQGQAFELIDLPGTYSLAPHSPDEMVAVDVLLGLSENESPPDVVLAIVDAANLQRNFFLLSQVLSLSRPTVVALNMVDVAERRGTKLDVEAISKRLGVPVVPVQANRGVGFAELKTELAKVARSGEAPSVNPFPEEFQQETVQLAEVLNSDRNTPLPLFLVERLLLDGKGYLEDELLQNAPPEHARCLHASRNAMAEAGFPVPAVEAMARYDWVGRVLNGLVEQPAAYQQTVSDRIDTVLTHKLWGTLVLTAVMTLLFSSIFVFADPLMGMVDDAFGSVGAAVEQWLPAGALRSLLVDGIIGGVGAVVIFLPQILILFGFIAVLEDCGYMARAAFLMDRLMAGVGLSGRSFIPMLSSFACAVPGIMAARVIENRRDRLTTILVAPLMSCSARLPVYVILIGAFVPANRYLGGIVGLQGLTLLAMYSIGIITAAGVAWLLKRTLLRGDTPPFVMELPGYKIPSLRSVLYRMADRGWAFVRRAGTVIFAVTIVIWALAYYPRNLQQVQDEIADQRAALESAVATASTDSAERAEVSKQLAEFNDSGHLQNLEDSLLMRNSFLGQAGQFIEPVVRPLGWDWRIGCAVIASFPAREVVLGVLGVIYNIGGDVDVGSEADQQRLGDRLRAARWDDTGKPVYNLPVALSLMVFFALCAQCAATLAVIRRETGSWRWPAFTFAYMTTLAYFGAMLTYQVASRVLG